MRKTLLLTILLSGVFLSQAQSVSDFKWLTGTWERQNTKPESTAFESWEKMTKMGLQGQGTTLRGVDTVFVEELSILERNNKLYYVAKVSHNSEPTYFEITSFNKNGFVCENPNHDFPKKIDYQMNDNLLLVTISGDGKEIPFQFLKIN